MSNLTIATALGMQQAAMGKDATMMMLKQVIQQEQAVLQVVQSVTQPSNSASMQPYLGQHLNLTV